jgi:serine/threonine protein kinase
MAKSGTAQNPTPPRIPDYKLIRCIGTGGYGEVWLGQNEVMHTYCAVKVVRRERFEHADPFNREFRGLQKSVESSRSHPGLVGILHAGKNDPEGFFFYVMELADDLETGQNVAPDRYIPKTLSRLQSSIGRMPLEQCFQLGIAITDALRHLHEHGLIHRDIKSANIIFVRDIPKIADIGVVTTIGDSSTQIVGSPGYMPPEGPGKPNGDLYSLGKVLYCIATGKGPEDFPDLPTNLDEIVDVPGFSKLNTVLLKACERDPEKRYQSATEMREALSDAREIPIRPEAAGLPALHQTEPSQRSRLVSIIYKSNVQPDGRLLDLLEAKLRDHGYQVFIDRHLNIGVQWAQEIEAKIRCSDAIIVLLSPASIQSEMVAYEVEIAYDAAQHQGKPALLPIRVAYHGALSEPLARILNPLQHTIWKSPADDQRIVSELLNALQNPPVTKSLPTAGQFAPPVGIVPLDSKHYVVRPADDEFRAAISRQDSIVLIKGARQIGKTSLLARGLEHARKENRKVVVTDFQMLNSADLQSAETLFKALASSIDADLQLNARPLKNWNSQTAPNLNFRLFMESVLGKVSAPLVWGLDEVDRLFTCSFGSEVFGLFRSWHNRRSLEPASPLSRLTLAIAYATEAHLFITDVNQSPFNVGTRLTLDDFTFEQVSDLNRRYGTPLRNNEELNQFFMLVGGQPYLVRRGLHELVSRSIGIAGFAEKADRDEGVFGDHLRRILVMLVKNPQLIEVVRGMLRGQPCPTQESFYRLRTAGIMTGDSMQDTRLRCQVYDSYLKHHLL